jgi:hypothetical protein
VRKIKLHGWTILPREREGKLKVKLVLMFVLVSTATLLAEDCKVSPIVGPHVTLVIYRYRLFLGSGRRASVYLDNQKMCSLSNGRYLIIEVSPGVHKLRSSDDKHGGVEQDFLPGQVFFYRVHIEATNAFQITNF